MSSIIIDHAASILKAFDIEPKPLDRTVDNYFRRHREIGSANRRSISDIVFGLIRWRRRIDGLLELDGKRKPTNRERVEFYLSWNDFPAADAMPKKFPGGEAAFYSFPDFLYDRLVKAYGKKAAAKLAMRLNEPALPCLRVNTLLASRDKVLNELVSGGLKASPTKISPYGLLLNRRVSLENLDVFKKGLVEIQDEGSQLVVIFADPKPNELVLDACAGAGGKTLMMAMLMKNQGRIIAADPDAHKLKELERRRCRAGAANIEMLETGKLLKKIDLKGKFDLVLVDAPCSGTGTLRRSPDLRWRLSPEIILERVNIQRELIMKYADWVRPGGRIVYATCSILPEENEGAIGEFLKRGKFGQPKYLRTDPCQGEWDGFFAASIKKL